MNNERDLQINDFIITTSGDFAQVLDIGSHNVKTDKLGVVDKHDIVNYHNKITYLVEEGDYINGARVYRRSGDNQSLLLNGHSVHSTEVMQVMSKKKFYNSCYSPVGTVEETEEWKQISGFPLYEVSNKGIVRSIKSGKYMSYLQDRETLSVRLECPDGRRLRKSVAVLVLEAFKGDCEGRIPKFINGDYQNCNLSNLEWETRSDQAIRVLPKRKQTNRNYKYRNIVGYFNGEPIVRAIHSRALKDFLQMHAEDFDGLTMNHLTRSIRDEKPYYGIMFKCVSDEEYEDICSYIDNKKFIQVYKTQIKDKNHKLLTDMGRKEVRKIEVNRTVKRKRVYNFESNKNIPAKPVERPVRTFESNKNTPTKQVTKPVRSFDEPTDSEIMELEKELAKEKFRRELLKRLK